MFWISLPPVDCYYVILVSKMTPTFRLMSNVVGWWLSGQIIIFRLVLFKLQRLRIDAMNLPWFKIKTWHMCHVQLNIYSTSNDRRGPAQSRANEKQLSGHLSRRSRAQSTSCQESKQTWSSSCENGIAILVPHISFMHFASQSVI
jgi:hypothetical protein